MGKVAKRRHPAESPFDDKWRREVFAALVAYPHCMSIAFYLADCHDELPGSAYGKELLSLARELVHTRSRRWVQE